MSTPPSGPLLHPLEEQRAALGAQTFRRCSRPTPTVFAAVVAWDDWLVDLSKERLRRRYAALVAHARARPAGWIAALFAGEKINLSEGRPALHTALRQQDDTPLVVDGHDIVRRFARRRRE